MLALLYYPFYVSSLIYLTQKETNHLELFNSGRSQVIGQISLYQCKGMSGTAVLHVFCNQASKLC